MLIFAQNKFTLTGHACYPAPIYGSPILLLLFPRPTGRVSPQLLGALQEARCCECKPNVILRLALLSHLCLASSFSCWGSPLVWRPRKVPQCRQAPLVVRRQQYSAGLAFSESHHQGPAAVKQPKTAGVYSKSAPCYSPGWIISCAALSLVMYTLFSLSFYIYV